MEGKRHTPDPTAERAEGKGPVQGRRHPMPGSWVMSSKFSVKLRGGATCWGVRQTFGESTYVLKSVSKNKKANYSEKTSSRASVFERPSGVGDGGLGLEKGRLGSKTGTGELASACSLTQRGYVSSWPFISELYRSIR